MRPAVMRRVGALAIALGLLASLAVSSALAASITVNSTADSAADDGACTLREAITAANTDTSSGASVGECAAGSGTDAITFSVAGTITLTSALPQITSGMSIDGAGGAITVNGASTHRVFNVSATGTATLSGLTITGGAAGIGGGINNAGTLTVTNSTISGNSASTEGGGIANLLGTLVATNVTISGNSAVLGGGIAILDGTLVATNVTISGNTASAGGGGIFALGTETLVNAIVAGNTAPIGPDIDVVAESITTSVIGVPGGMTLADILDPAGLADNGGPTQTIALALVAGNPAIDLATSAVCAAAPVNALDQRGLPRPAACDIGAYEAQPPTVAAHANVSAPATSAAGAVVSYTAPAGTDEQGGAATVACLPASGSTFAVGSTTVTCTATDAVGHTGTGTFQVIVGAFAATTATPSPSPSPSPSASPVLLPNTAAPGATNSIYAFIATFALLGLLSVAVLARTHHRVRGPGV